MTYLVIEFTLKCVIPVQLWGDAIYDNSFQRRINHVKMKSLFVD